MSAYQQMGHHSENLLFEPHLRGFSGAILSPVNYGPEDMAAQVSRVRGQLSQEYDLVFDPQLYYPSTERGVLDTWSYFPEDVDTADLSSMRWWDAILRSLAEEAAALGVNAVCSPAVVPRTFGSGYYSQLSGIAEALHGHLAGSGLRLFQTALIDCASITDPGQPELISSILTQGEPDEVFLVAHGAGEPRREVADSEPLKGFMRLIAALEGAGVRVLVGFSSSDVVLWKAAGASHCATGKFFNLRRFTASRFEEPGGGGGQLPYWFEEGLLAFLRESDLLRVREEGLLSEASLGNPFGQSILQSRAENPEEPWLGLAWRQWMYWFQDFHARAERSTVDFSRLLATAERNWLYLEDNDVFMEEPRNDGSWIRPWRRALAEYSR